MVVVDAATGDASSEHQGLQLGDARFVAAPRARSFGDAVDTALANVEPGTWLWLLHDDSAPAPDALAELLRAVEHSSAVAVAGPKQERWVPGTDAQPAAPFEPGTVSRLVEVGVTTTPLGRRLTGIDEDEVDQGQHDAREDVLAVGLAGALVRRTVWQELGGTDPELGPFGDGLDLCRRARLAGHRVVVVPSAVVRHAQASLLGLRERRRGTTALPAPDPDASSAARRHSQLHARLVGVASPWLLFVALAMVVGAPFHAAFRLLVKQPGQAWDELLAPLWALVRVGPVVRARRVARRTRRLPRRALRPLRGTWREVLAERRDRRLARAEQRRTAWAPTDIERRELRALAVRRRAGLAGAVVVLAGFTAVVFGPLAGLSSRAGGSSAARCSRPPGRSATCGARRRRAGSARGSARPRRRTPSCPRSSPRRCSPGRHADRREPARPRVLPRRGPGRVVRRGRGHALRAAPRLGDPRLGGCSRAPHGRGRRPGRRRPRARHAPWLALAVVRALGLQRLDVVAPPTQDVARRAVRREPGSLAAAATAGLLLAVAVAGAPVLLPVGVVVLVVVALGARAHRRYLALVPVPSLVLFAPFLVHMARTAGDGGWRLLLADPGRRSRRRRPRRGSSSWGCRPRPRRGSGSTGRSRRPPGALGPVRRRCGRRGARRPRGAARPSSGRGGVVRRGARAGRGRPRRVDRGGHRDDARRPGHGLAGRRPVARSPRPPRCRARGRPRWPGAGAPAWRSGTVVALALVVTLLPLGAAASWTVGVLDRDDARVGAVVATTEPVVPPVGRQMQSSPRQARVLTLELGPGDVVEYGALRSDGPQAVDSSAVVHAWQAADPR